MRRATTARDAILFGLLIFLSWACRVEFRSGSNEQDLKESIKIAEDYLQNLKELKYEAALQLSTSRLRSLITSENLRTDFEGRFEGKPIQSWTLKSHQIIGGAPRHIGLLYQVQNLLVSHEVAITTELVPDPDRWQVASVIPANSPAADKNADEAKITAEKFLVHLRAHNYAAAHQLISTLGQKAITQVALRDLWEKLEQRRGTVNSWTLVGNNDSTANLSGNRQRYTMMYYAIDSSRGGAGIVFTMIRTEKGWEIEGAQLRDNIPS